MKQTNLKYYISAIIIGIMIVFAVIYLLRADKSAQASWWDASWLYRKSIEVTNTSGGSLSDFQIKILNNIDLSSDINLEKIQSNLNDLRFTDLNGNPLSYWIEDTTSTSVDVWLRITNIPESGTSVYMYYGNSIADPGKSTIGTSDFPALSCKSILDSGSSMGSGNYFLDFTNGYLSDESQIYCDMENNDGGWMLVKPSMVSSVVTRYVGVSASTDSNGGASYTFTHQDIGCDSNDTGATVQVTSTIQWDKVRAKHSIVSGLSYCWSMDGTGNYGGQRTNSNLETFSVGTDVVQGCVLSCEDPQFVIPPLTRCDDTAENYAIYNGTSERSFELISRRKNRTSASGPALGLSCNDMNMTSKIENIYIKEDYLTYPNVSVGIFGSQELALGIAGVSATLGSRTGVIVPPIVYYNFDEGYGTTTYNYVSSTPNGIITGASFTNDGKFGKALNFSGATHNVSISNIPVDTAAGAKHTVSFWMKWNGVYGGMPFSWTQYDLWFYSNCFGFNTYSSNVYGINPSAYANKWTHVAAVFDNAPSNPSTLEMYINGVKQNLSLCTGSHTPRNVSSNAIIGKGFDGYAYTGLIDEFKIYKYALSADQVNVDYNQGMAMVMGQSGTSTSASSEYCVPGDTGFCTSPVLEYKFEKKSGALAYDTSGNNNNGTITSAVSTLGKFGNAMSFDGINDSLTKTSTSNLKSLNGTISYWLYIRNKGVGQGLMHIYQNNLDTSDYVRSYIHPSNLMDLIIEDDDVVKVNVYYDLDNLGDFTNKWLYVSWVQDGGSVKLYINGQLKSLSGTNSGSWWTNHLIDPIHLRIGRAWDYFDGSIDEVRIYNYARTPSQIAWDFNKGAPIVHYKFDECSDVTVHDESGNGGVGIITIGAGGSQNAAGTCVDNDTLHAWYNGRIGKYKSSLSFDGTDDYINAGSNIIIGTSSFSMSGWFKRSLHSDYGGAMNMGVANSSQSTWLGWCTTAQVGTSNSLGGGFYGRNYGSGITDNSWHHMVLTYSGGVAGTAKLYVDGILKVTDPGFTPNIGSGNIYFGKFPTGTPYWYNGQIDDAKIFNYALTSQQVELEYAGNAIKFN